MLSYACDIFDIQLDMKILKEIAVFSPLLIMETRWVGSWFIWCNSFFFNFYLFIYLFF